MNDQSRLGGHVAAGVVIAAAAVLVAVASPSEVLQRLEWLAANPVWFGGALVILTVVRPFFVWPNTLLAVAVGYGYGWIGLPVAVVLLTLTALPAYWLSRAGTVRARSAVPAVDRLCGTGERLTDITGSARAVAAIRLFPIPSDAVSVAAGGSAVRLRPFVFGTALGEIPWAVLGVAVGVSLERFVGGATIAFDPVVIIGLASLGVLLLAGPLYRAYVTKTATLT